jgi:hypothetical protein
VKFCDAPVAENDCDPAADTDMTEPPKVTARNVLTNMTGSVRRAQKVGGVTGVLINEKSKKKTRACGAFTTRHTTQ